MDRTDIYKSITQKIISKLEEGVLPWKKPWKNGLPMNFITKKPYSGINFLSLLTNDYPSSYYITFLQCKNCKGTVNNGSKGELVVYWKMGDVVISEEEVRKVPFIRYSYVFNLSQTSLFNEPVLEIKIKSCEEIINNLPIKPVIKHNISRCYYSLNEDYISIPLITDFNSREEYYSSLFHELIHWTAHPNRLNRNEDYAFEELVAEIGTSFICGLCCFEEDSFNNQVSYIDYWLKKLKSDPHYLILASQKAQKAIEFLRIP